MPWLWQGHSQLSQIRGPMCLPYGRTLSLGHPWLVSSLLQSETEYPHEYAGRKHQKADRIPPWSHQNWKKEGKEIMVKQWHPLTSYLNEFHKKNNYEKSCKELHSWRYKLPSTDSPTPASSRVPDLLQLRWRPVLWLKIHSSKCSRNLMVTHIALELGMSHGIVGRISDPNLGSFDKRVCEIQQISAPIFP